MSLVVIKETRRKDTILLVEDDRELREYMQRFLEDLGYRVALATDEADSLRLVDADHTQIQLILLNQRMVSDDALAAGRRIREYVNVPNPIPVVVLPFEFTKALEGTDQNMGDGYYKSYMTTEQQLEDLLAGLLRDRLESSAFRVISSTSVQ
ncbi:MAG TPA: response regulator [Pyrinomonadaceae bacterium]|nr:response regulator [Pyrinomonadaceae bacterium]